jgi:restriction system protein
MPIPDFQTLMLPLLKFVAGGERHIRDVVEHLSDEFNLTADERQALLPSGKQHVIANRAHWAGTFLVQAGLLNRPSRGRLLITQRGRDLLGSKPTKIDVTTLRQYPEFIAFKSRKHTQDENPAEELQQ